MVDDRIRELALRIRALNASGREFRCGGKVFGEGGDVKPVKRSFDDWAKQISAYKGIDVLGDDTYDYKGFYNADPAAAYSMLLGSPDVHFTDKYKKPNHPTFSDESIYHSDKTPGGHWVQDVSGRWVFQHSAYTAQHADATDEYLRMNDPGSYAVFDQGELAPAVAEVSPDFWMDKEFMRRQMFMESDFRDNVVSNANAYGPWQIIPDEAELDYMRAHGLKEHGDLTDLEYATKVRNWYMELLANKEYIKKDNQSPEVWAAKTAAAYNWGGNNLKKFLTKLKAEGYDIYNSMDWVNRLPQEVKNYVRVVVQNKNPVGLKPIIKKSKARYQLIKALRSPFAQGGFLRSFEGGGILPVDGSAGMVSAPVVTDGIMPVMLDSDMAYIPSDMESYADMYAMPMEASMPKGRTPKIEPKSQFEAIMYAARSGSDKYTWDGKEYKIDMTTQFKNSKNSKTKVEDFVNRFYPLVTYALESRGIDSEKYAPMVLSQIAHETGYGTKSISGYNLGGIKWTEAAGDNGYDYVMQPNDRFKYIDFKDYNKFLNYLLSILDTNWNAFSSTDIVDYVKNTHAAASGRRVKDVDGYKGDYSESYNAYLNSLPKMHSLMRAYNKINDSYRAVSNEKAYGGKLFDEGGNVTTPKVKPIDQKYIGEDGMMIPKEQYYQMQAEAARLLAKQKSDARKFAEVPQIGTDDNGNPIYGASCLYTATDNYNPWNMVAGNYTLMENPDKYGFTPIPYENRLPGDIAQAQMYIPEHDVYHPYHSMIYDGNESGVDRFTYSRGYGRINNDADIVHKGKFPILPGDNARLQFYRFTGNDQDKANWDKDYYKLMNQFVASQPMPILPTGTVTSNDQPKLAGFNDRACGGGVRRYAAGGPAVLNEIAAQLAALQHTSPEYYQQNQDAEVLERLLRNPELAQMLGLMKYIK